jgi:hypothetical protein
MMRRIGLPTSLTFLSMAIVLACWRATPAHAGPDQLWYFPWHTARQANFVNMKDVFAWMPRKQALAKAL